MQHAMFCTVGIYSLASLPIKLNFFNLMDRSVEILVHISYSKNIILSYFNVQYSSFSIIFKKKDLTLHYIISSTCYRNVAHALK